MWPGSAFSQQPGFLFQVIDSLENGFANTEVRFPAQRADLRAIKKNERTVANPSPVSAGIGNRGLQSEVLTDPPDRVIDLAILVGAQIEDVYAGVCLFDGQQHGIDAVVYVQIRFPLVTIPEYMQFVRMFEQLPVKIENVTVRVALAQDGNEAKNVRLHSESCAICLDQTFGSDL